MSAAQFKLATRMQDLSQLFLFFRVSQRLQATRIHSCRLLHSRRQLRLLQTQLSEARPISSWVLRKMLLSVSSFLPAPVWTFTTTFRWSRMRARLTITPQKHRCTNDFYISLHGSFMWADFFILYETFLPATAF